MDKHIITETVNGVTNYIGLNGNGELVTASQNPMELPAFMTKEQAFKVIAGLRAANPETKYRVKAVSQALRDMITDIIVNQLPAAAMVTDETIETALAAWKPAKVEAKEAKAAEPVEVEAKEEVVEPETETEPKQAPEPEAEPVVGGVETAEEPAEPEAKAAKKAKKQNK